MPQKIRELKEVVLVGETSTGEKLAPWKIMLKDEEIERLLPGLGAFSEGVRESPLVVHRPTPLGAPVPASEKKRKSFLLSLPPLDLRSDEEKEEKDKKGEEEEGTKGKKEESLLAAFASAPSIEGSGDKMEEVTTEKGVVLPAAPSATFGTEGV
ncbi:hypothetical protein AXF42_Ash009648 [Apostasia shenzhenica]|uniref:Uncharacterized protein n=1 Tax=Apostasia shenzhenica TaxID=1088818 RepID=A0A2I0AWN9_9ASPA|nr:hypothetical protein AXF42_Ash009648 [Apostasia shenzhenica]